MGSLLSDGERLLLCGQLQVIYVIELRKRSHHKLSRHAWESCAEETACVWHMSRKLLALVPVSEESYN